MPARTILNAPSRYKSVVKVCVCCKIAALLEQWRYMRLTPCFSSSRHISTNRRYCSSVNSSPPLTSATAKCVKAPSASNPGREIACKISCTFSFVARVSKPMRVIPVFSAICTRIGFPAACAAAENAFAVSVSHSAAAMSYSASSAASASPT